MSWLKQDRVNRFGVKEQLCWTCNKCTGGCSWSHSYEPIKGWDADVDTMRCGESHAGKTVIYRIYDCPEYEGTGKPVVKEKKENKCDDVTLEAYRIYKRMLEYRKKARREGKEENKTENSTV